MAAGQFLDARGILREADGRFARKDGSAGTPGRSRSRSGGSAGGVHGAGRSRGGGSKKSTTEKITLSAADISSSHLRKSSNPTKRRLGAIISAAGSVARNRTVRAALREESRKRKQA